MTISNLMEMAESSTNRHVKKKTGLEWERVKPLTNDKILDVTKLKASADNKLIVAKVTISLFDRVENTVGK